MQNPPSDAERARALALLALSGTRLQGLLRRHPNAELYREALGSEPRQPELRQLLFDELAASERLAQLHDEGLAPTTPLGYRLRRRRVERALDLGALANEPTGVLQPWFAMSAVEVQDASTELGLTLLALLRSPAPPAGAEESLRRAVRTAAERIAAARGSNAVPRVLGRAALATLYGTVDVEVRRAWARSARSNLGEVLSREKALELSEPLARRPLEAVIGRIRCPKD